MSVGDTFAGIASSEPLIAALTVAALAGLVSQLAAGQRGPWPDRHLTERTLQ